MKKITLFGLIILVPSLLVNFAGASDDLEKEYYAALSAHFGVEADSLAALLELELDIKDLPVVLFLSQINKTGPSRIAGLRAKGESWMKIIENRVISPSVFYFMLTGEIESQTFAPIFAEYKALPERRWGEIVLTDDEICDMVNLKFIYSYHDYSVFEVMKMRDLGKSYPEINYQVKVKREEMIKEEKRKKQEEAKKKKAEGK